MRLPYFACFTGFIFISLIFLGHLAGKSLLTKAMLGMLLGEILGTISLSIANLFIQNGVERNLMTFRANGIFSIVETDATVAFVLGCWLLGGISFLLFAVAARKIEM